MCVHTCVGVRKALCRYMRECVHVMYVCMLAPLSMLCDRVSGDTDLFLSRLINEEIKVSVSQSRHKDTGKGGTIRHPAGTSEILIRPSLYFLTTARHCGRLFRQSVGLFSPSALPKPVMGHWGCAFRFKRRPLHPTTFVTNFFCNRLWNLVYSRINFHSVLSLCATCRVRSRWCSYAHTQMWAAYVKSSLCLCYHWLHLTLI